MPSPCPQHWLLRATYPVDQKFSKVSALENLLRKLTTRSFQNLHATLAAWSVCIYITHTHTHTNTRIYTYAYTYTPKNVHRRHVDSKPHDDVTAIVLSAGGPRALPPLLCMHQGVCKNQEEEIPHCQKNKNKIKQPCVCKVQENVFHTAQKSRQSVL
jgi:hypothetical protein